jgi:O-antigen/teichoic acid export membrane protein
MAVNNNNNNNNFTGQGVLLFVDVLLVAATNWIFWLIVSKLISASEIGQASIVYSLVLLFSTLSQLGLEYPLLKNSVSHGSSILVSSLAIEAVITIILIPVLYYVGSTDAYHWSASSFVWISMGLLVFMALAFVTRFALLGISNARGILLRDVIGVASKFILGLGLISIGFGALGILLSFLFFNVVVTILGLILVLKRFHITRYADIQWHSQTFLQLVKEALLNAPAKFSRFGMLIVSLSIVLLGIFGISDAEIGIFYMTTMISLVFGSLASSISYSVIPASSLAKSDLSDASLRIGLGLTSPLISALAVVPAYVLSMLGPEYTSGGSALFILSISILPSTIVTNSISKFNHSNEFRKIIVMGCIQFAAFLIPFMILVPIYGILGAAVSILLSYLTSSIPSLFWSNGYARRYVVNSTIATFAGILLGYAILWGASTIHPVMAIFASVTLTTVVTLLFKSTTPQEIKEILKSIR